MFTIEDIRKEYLKGSSQRYSESKNERIKKFIESQITLDLNHKEKVYCYINSIVPSCKCCGNIPSFQNFTIGFNEYCSVSCQVRDMKDIQEKARVKNINDTVKNLSVEEIVSGLFHKTIKIQKWRDVDKLKKYADFKTIDQLYKHLILNQNQVCPYCEKVFGVDKKTKEPRKCMCTTKEDRLLLDLDTKVIGKEFIEFIVQNKLHYNSNENLINEYSKRVGFLPFTDSLTEDIYCQLHNIVEKQDTQFINLAIGYKKKHITVNHSQMFDKVISDLKLKYSEKGFTQAQETKDFLKDYPGDSIYEKIFLAENERPRCKVCGEKTKFIKHERRYKDYCSIVCANKGDAQNKTASFKEKFHKTKLCIILKNNKLTLLSKYEGVKEYHDFSCNVCGNIFSDTFINNLPICLICNPRNTGVSNEEIEVREFIKSITNANIVCNGKKFGFELDMYLPEYKFAVEYNGLYYHTTKFKSKDLHLKKTEVCEKNDIQLFHIYSHQWRDKQDIVKSMIRNKLGLSERIYARKCFIKEVSSRESNEFLDKNHLQGRDNAKYRYGLYHENELVQLITFKRSHRSKDRYMELKRSCSKLGYNVIGGFSKLLKHALKIFDEDIITFADRSHSSKDNVYEKNGFEFIGKLPPNYRYLVNGELESREKYQKHKLKNILKNFDENLSEKENMNNNNFFEIYDSGNYKYIFRKKT